MLGHATISAPANYSDEDVLVSRTLTGAAMDLGDLAIFHAVAHEGGTLRAARRLHRVPSSVSTRIRQLEGSVGAELFVRGRQRLHLSADSEMLLAYAERLLRLADEARGAVGTR